MQFLDGLFVRKSAAFGPIDECPFSGLDPEKRYRVTLKWPGFLVRECGNFAGSTLMGYGLQLPQSHPDTCLIYHLKAET